MLRVYCEHGALSSGLRSLASGGHIDLVHFPHDPDSRIRRAALVAPANPRWSDMNVRWEEVGQLGMTWEGLADPGELPRILALIGHANRRDGQHLEAARKANAWAFVSGDTDILAHRTALEKLLQMRVLDTHGAASAISGHLGLVGAEAQTE